jgi:DNA-directed RNA polymerase specialized sigma24 family protein
MDSGPAQSDVEIRASIDELKKAEEDVRRVREVGDRWQQENPPPKEPKTVRRMAEVDEFKSTNEAWNKLYGQRRERLEQAQARLHAAQRKLVSLLPQHIGYEYKGKRYQREGNAYRVDNIG